MKMPDKVYEFLKWILITVVPAAITMIGANNTAFTGFRDMNLLLPSSEQLQRLSVHVLESVRQITERVTNDYGY